MMISRIPGTVPELPRKPAKTARTSGENFECVLNKELKEMGYGGAREGGVQRPVSIAGWNDTDSL